MTVAVQYVFCSDYFLCSQKHTAHIKIRIDSGLTSARSKNKFLRVAKHVKQEEVRRSDWLFLSPPDSYPPSGGGGFQGAFFVQGGLAGWARPDPPITPHPEAKACATSDKSQPMTPSFTSPNHTATPNIIFFRRAPKPPRSGFVDFRKGFSGEFFLLLISRDNFKPGEELWTPHRRKYQM